MLSEDMRENLILYYSWARVNDPSDVGYPHQDPTSNLRGGGIGCEGLSDDEAMQIDRALAVLGVEYPEERKVVEMFYQKGYTFRRMERHGHGSRKELSQMLNSAHDFLKGFLCSYQAA